ncbi:glycosyltransferase [Virgibacillus kimchii]
MKKKVLFFLYSLSGGGAERTVVNIINNMDKNKFDIILVLGTNKNNDYMKLVSNDLKVKVLGASKLRFSLFKLRKVISSDNPDLLFSTINANNIILLLAKILTFKKIPTIVREASNRSQSGTVSNLNKFVTYLLYNYFANKVISLSKGVKEDLVKNFHINKNKIETIYNPIEIETINKLSNEKIDDFYRIKGENLVVAAGRLVEAKDFFTLIKAFKIVSSNTKAKLLILGKGPQETELKNLSKKLGLEDKIIFLGFKKNPYKYMREAKVFVLSSKWEGFGHVIVESMASGTPVISTNCNSGPAEIIEDNKYGILVPVEDYYIMAEKVIEILNNDEMRRNYKALGLKRADKFNVKIIVDEYEKVFNKHIK